MRSLIRTFAVVAALFALAPAALAAAPPEHQVFTDGTNDGSPLAPDFTPAFYDLTAGFISETDDAIAFTWEVVDLPDDPLYMPFATYFWEFQIAPTLDEAPPACGSGGECFSLRAFVGNDGTPGGVVESNCTNETGAVVDCEVLENVSVSVTVDGAANQITASIPRADLRDYANTGQDVIAVDGAVLFEVDLFNGIAAHATAGVSCTCIADTADLDAGIYVLGTNR